VSGDGMDGGYAASLVEYSPGCARARSRGRAGGAARFVSFLGLRRPVGLGEGAARPVLLLTQRIWTEKAARLLPAGRLGPGCFVSIGGDGGGSGGRWLQSSTVPPRHPPNVNTTIPMDVPSNACVRFARLTAHSHGSDVPRSCVFFVGKRQKRAGIQKSSHAKDVMVACHDLPPPSTVPRGNANEQDDYDLQNTFLFIVAEYQEEIKIWEQ
jgi:hypothetical protein